MFCKMPLSDFSKKFKFLKPPDSTLGVVGCFSLCLCLILCFFLLDYSVVENFHGNSSLMTWFKSNGSLPGQEMVGFLEAGGDGCDVFNGRWEWDERYPLYQSRDCAFLDEGFRCSENGRPDNFYTKWRWQPNHCNLPRFVFAYVCEREREFRLANWRC